MSRKDSGQGTRLELSLSSTFSRISPILPKILMVFPQQTSDPALTVISHGPPTKFPCLSFHFLPPDYVAPIGGFFCPVRGAGTTFRTCSRATLRDPLASSRSGPVDVSPRSFIGDE